MNILVLGNGFDLAHGLPTKYTDFLDWLKDIEHIGKRLVWEDDIPTTNNDFIDWRNKREGIWTIKFDESFLSDYWQARKDEYIQRRMLKTSSIKNWILEHNNAFDFERDIHYINHDIKDFIKDDINNKKIEVKNFSEIFSKISNSNYSFEFYNKERILITEEYLSNENAFNLFYLINCNFWVKYFIKYSQYHNENWIDFEKVISDLVIKLNGGKEHIDNLYREYVPEQSLNQSQKKVKMLEHDLKRFILLLEIYLCVYVQNVNCMKLSKDINDINIEKIISFNYTNTYEKIYDNNKNVEYDYIHGKADINNTIDTNNMVLGIDEYLPEDRRDKDVEFIVFKKFYQRIHKQTGCEYKNWVEEIKASCEKGVKRNFMRYISKVYTDDGKSLNVLNTKKNITHNLYIFGHSLDITDKDVLCDLILHDNVHTTIFYLNKEVMGQQIANLVKVIGQDELIKRTGGSTKTIEFRQQQDMIEINDSKTNNT